MSYASFLHNFLCNILNKINFNKMQKKLSTSNFNTRRYYLSITYHLLVFEASVQPERMKFAYQFAIWKKYYHLSKVYNLSFIDIPSHGFIPFSGPASRDSNPLLSLRVFWFPALFLSGGARQTFSRESYLHGRRT